MSLGQKGWSAVVSPVVIACLAFLLGMQFGNQDQPRPEHSAENKGESHSDSWGDDRDRFLSELGEELKATIAKTTQPVANVESPNRAELRELLDELTKATATLSALRSAIGAPDNNGDPEQFKANEAAVVSAIELANENMKRASDEYFCWSPLQVYREFGPPDVATMTGSGATVWKYTADSATRYTSIAFVFANGVVFRIHME